MPELRKRKIQLICLSVTANGVFLALVLIPPKAIPHDAPVSVSEVRTFDGKIVEMSPYFSTAASKNPNGELRRHLPHKIEGVDVCIEFRNSDGQTKRIYETWDLPTVDYFNVGFEIPMVTYASSRTILWMDFTWPEIRSIVLARRFLSSASESEVKGLAVDWHNLDHVFEKLSAYNRIFFREQNAKYQSSEVFYRGIVDDAGEYRDDAKRRMDVIRNVLGSRSQCEIEGTQTLRSKTSH